MKRKAPRPDPRAADAFVREMVGALAPLIAPAAEKAELLVDACGSDVHPTGLAPTIRKLAARHGEPAVRAAVEAVLADARRWGSTREPIA